LSALGLGLIVVTNQSGVARGYFDLARVEEIHRRMQDLLVAEGVRLDAICVCPHLPEDDCPCRKPRPELIHRAAAQFGFEPSECFVIGDKPCDIELGQAVSATTILVRNGYGAEHEAAGSVCPGHVADDLSAASDLIARLLA
jgi:D-glycero-D-manno-heptose 1,7-bisphosphate phosphatase